MRKDHNKPKGKTSAYAFFVQTCREEHRKKNPEQSVNFAEFSKKCSERWKVRHAADRESDRFISATETHGFTSERRIRQKERGLPEMETGC